MAGTLVAPPAPTLARVLLDWQPDPFLVPLLVAAGLYLAGVRRLEHRGRRWPAARSACFLSGLATLLLATQSGLAAYDRVSFSLHVVQHLLLGMLGPLLLALGAPVTLALQAGARPTQSRLLRVLHHPALRSLTHPLTAWALFGGSLVALYFTPLYELSLRNDWVHALVHVHFVSAGCVFMWVVVGLDPVAGRPGYGARLLYVFVALPFHAFLGVALLSDDKVIAARWYGQVIRPWGGSWLAEQRLGAGLLWSAGELFGVVALVVVALQWVRHEERVAARLDRVLDRTTP